MNILVAADLHYFAQKRDIREVEFDWLYDLIEITDDDHGVDMIIIAGDYWDKIYSLNSKHAKQAISHFLELLDLCRERNIKLRVLKGTVSHDNNQFEIFDTLSDAYDEKSVYKYIETFSHENVKDKDGNNHKIYYIPEEIIDDKHEYYKELFENKDANSIFFHGTFSFAGNVSTPSENHIAAAPVFNEAKFMDLCDGAIVGGHIHKPMSYKNKIYYTGSFSRTSFGEDEAKGVIFYQYNGLSDYKIERFLNPHAPTFKRIDITSMVEEGLTDVEIKKRIAKLKKDNHKVEVVTSKPLHANLRDSLKGDTDIKLTTVAKETVQKDMSKYDYIENMDGGIASVIQRFIKEESDVDIDINDIEKAISIDE